MQSNDDESSCSISLEEVPMSFFIHLPPSEIHAQVGFYVLFLGESIDEAAESKLNTSGGLFKHHIT